MSRCVKGTTKESWQGLNQISPTCFPRGPPPKCFFGTSSGDFLFPLLLDQPFTDLRDTLRMGSNCSYCRESTITAALVEHHKLGRLTHCTTIQSRPQIQRCRSRLGSAPPVEATKDVNTRLGVQGPGCLTSNEKWARICLSVFHFNLISLWPCPSTGGAVSNGKLSILQIAGERRTRAGG